MSLSSRRMVEAFKNDVETEEEEAAYAAWLRAKVREAELDTRPGVPHEKVMADMEARIDAAIARHQQKAAA